MSSKVKLGLVEPSKLKNILVMISVFALVIPSSLLLVVTRFITWIALLTCRPIHEHIMKLIWRRINER
jgi:hypothetical protein